MVQKVAFLLVFGALCAAQNRYALVLNDSAVSRSVRKEAVARGMVVTGEVDTLLHAVFVAVPKRSRARVASIPGVARVVPMRTFKLNLNRAVSLVNASGAWTALGGVANAGAGMKIGILDTGIDQMHPAFQDAALVAPSGYPICAGADCTYTSNKVIVARSYIAMLGAGSDPTNPAADSRPDDFSPRDRTGHGTAIASVAAGNTNTGVLTITGMAPHAFLGNYRIFGSPEVNDTTTEDVVIKAAEDAMKDGMDVISLSLGVPALYGPLDSGAACVEPAGTACDLLASAMEAAAQAGLIVVVAAGNDGQTGTSYPGYGTVRSPAIAPSVIAVGASTNSHTVSGTVTVAGTSQNYPAYPAAGANSSNITAPGIDAGKLGGALQACSALPVGSLTGSIALIERGTCTFLVKLQNAQAAGAVGVIFYMADGSAPIFPSGLAGAAIPSVMLANSDGTALQNYLDTNPGASLTINFSPIERLLTVYNQLASFSSQGPVTGTNAMKPDLVAVGTNMYMAAQSYDPLGDLYGANGYTTASGTSFAAPLVAGAAALVKQNHPGWTPAQVKSALVNTATTDVTQDDSGNIVTALSIGAGKLDAGAALGATVTVAPATISFGEVPPLPASQTITVTNNGSASVTLTLVDDGAHAARGVTLALSPSSLTLDSGASATVNVTLTGGTPGGGAYAGAIRITGPNVALRVPYLYLVPTGVAANLIPLYGDAFDGSTGDTAYLLFKLVDTNGLPVSGIVPTFKASAGAQTLATTSVIDSYGIAEAEVFTGVSPGAYTVTASAGGQAYVFTGSVRTAPLAQSIANAASATAGSPVAPGSFIAIFGLGLSDALNVASTLRLPLAINNVNVSFDVPAAGISAPGHLTFVSPGQINVQVPWELAGQTSALMKVTIGQSYGNVITVPLSDYAPAFFESAPGVVSALDLSYNAIGAANPALRGSTIQIYANGLGPVNNTPASGDPASTTVLSSTTTTPTVTIGGAYAPVVFSGLAPGLVGLYQVDVTVPGTLTPGNQPIVISIGGQTSTASGIVVQ